jgi:outer membrane protein TolC
MNKLMKNIFFILLLTTGAANAQERLTLRDAIARTLEHNFDIRIADVNAREAAANNTIGNAGMLPSISASGGTNTGSVNTRIEFVDGRVQEVQGARSVALNGSINLNWTLFDGGRMFLVKKQLNLLEDIGAIQLKQQIQTAVSNAIQAYAQVVWQQQQSVAIDTGLSLAKTRMLISRVKYETGSSAKVDYLQAQVDYNLRRGDSLALLAGTARAFTQLNVVMGNDPDQTYIVDDSLKLNTQLQPRNSELLENINLSLVAARTNVEVSRLNARIARTYHLPTVDLNGAYSYNRSQNQAGFTSFNRTVGPNGGININVPLFDGGNIRRVAKVASLQAMREELVYGRQNTEIARQYRDAWNNYRISVAAFNLESESIMYAKENVEIQKARFRVGIATTLETREAENSYVSALVRYYTAAYNLKVNETRVLELESALVQ